MKYLNPVIHSDFTAPDVVRAGSGFFMVASSANLVPSVPVYYSENLVEWRLVNYVLPEIPFGEYKSVRHAKGAGSPSIRCHNGKFYCLVPFVEYGIFVSETENPFGEWSPLRPLIEREGLKDPCPVWSNGRCFVVFAFDKTLSGVDSQLGVFEANEDLTAASDKFTLIYDGHNMAPQLETPKIYRHGKYFYILASAGGLKSGWQVELRSPDVFGPYESRIILTQGETEINGPRSGALVDVDGSGEKWAFLHTQSKGGFGNVLHLQPAVWLGDWVLCGKIRDEKLPAAPAAEADYPVDVKTDFGLNPSDEFDEERISAKWQNPANRRPEWAEMKRGLKLHCAYYGGNSLSDLPQIFLQKVPYKNFSIKTKCKLNLINDGDEAGFAVFGEEYAYICVVRRNGQNYLEIRKGSIGCAEDETLCQSQPYDENYVTFQTSARYEEHNKLTYKFTFGGSAFTRKFLGAQIAGSGALMGIYARANSESKGSAVFKFFRAVCTDNRVSKN